MPTDHRLSPHDHAALHDAAKAQARVLRREAVDAFWAAIARQIRQALQVARSAVIRAAHRRPNDPPHHPLHHRHHHHHHHGNT